MLPEEQTIKDGKSRYSLGQRPTLKRIWSILYYSFYYCAFVRLSKITLGRLTLVRCSPAAGARVEGAGEKKELVLFGLWVKYKTLAQNTFISSRFTSRLSKRLKVVPSCYSLNILSVMFLVLIINNKNLHIPANHCGKCSEQLICHQQIGFAILSPSTI